MTIQTSLSSYLKTKLPKLLHPLADIACNFWWSWSFESLSIFQSLDPEKWERYCHNPVKLLDSVTNERLEQLTADPDYCKRVIGLAAKFEQYMQKKDTWASQMAPQISARQPVAYFCIEYGFDLCLPIYAGGLGILAADHLKSASDLGLPLVGVGLLYHRGYLANVLPYRAGKRSMILIINSRNCPCSYARMSKGKR